MGEGFGGRLLHTCVYQLSNGKFKQHKFISDEPASQKQLAKLLQEE
jgi:hypothetical protein